MLESKIINAILIFAAFCLGSYVFTFALFLIERIAQRTQTMLDDRVLKSLKLPIRYLFVVLGFYYSFVYYGLTFEWKGYSIVDGLYVLIVLLIGFTLSRLVKTSLQWYLEKGDISKKSSKTMFVFLRRAISVAIYIIALIVILDYFGVKVAPLLAGLGVFGLAVALALQQTLTNLFAAIFLVMDRSVSIGDWIQLEDGTKAYIEDISWRSVKIRTVTGNKVIVPNALFVGQKISRFDYPKSPFSISVKAKVDHKSDLDHIEKIALRAAQNVVKKQGIKIDHENPVVYYKDFASPAVELMVNLKIEKAMDENQIKHILIKELVKEFKNEKIEFPLV